MVEEHESIFYEGRIKEIEKILIQFVIDSGTTKRSEIDSHLLTYMLLHPKLTQSQLHKLSLEFYKKKSKSGISRGKISSFLKSLEAFHILSIEKESEDKNYNYVYSLQGSLGDLLKNSVDQGLGLLHEMANFYSKKLESLANLPVHQRKEAYPTIILRVKELLEFWKYYGTLFKDFITGAEDKGLLKDFYKDIEEYSADLTLDDIEEEIIRVLSETTGFMVKNIHYTRILSYNILRKRLTQDELQELTGYSKGFISQALNYLVKEKLIERVKQKGIRKTYYTIESIRRSYFSRFINRLNRSLKYKPLLEDLLQELEEKKEKLKNLNGYNLIKQKLGEILEIYPKIEIILNILETELKKNV